LTLLDVQVHEDFVWVAHGKGLKIYSQPKTLITGHGKFNPMA